MPLTAGKAGIAGILALCVAAASVGTGPDGGDPKRGKERYGAICGGCHSVNVNRTGPMHRGVYGRKAGTVPGYDYSAALRNANVVWNDETLEKWLAGPEQFLPGQKMFVAVDAPRDRADIIAYLKTVSQ